MGHTGHSRGGRASQNAPLPPARRACVTPLCFTIKANLALSQQRAQTVVAYLVQRGVAAARLRAVGQGSQVPVADNRTEAGRAKNRRVELVRM
mgnify:CR=1 FL=1